MNERKIEKESQRHHYNSDDNNSSRITLNKKHFTLIREKWDCLCQWQSNIGILEWTLLPVSCSISAHFVLSQCDIILCIPKQTFRHFSLFPLQTICRIHWISVVCFNFISIYVCLNEESSIRLKMVNSEQWTLARVVHVFVITSNCECALDRCLCRRCCCRRLVALASMQINERIEFKFDFSLVSMSNGEWLMGWNCYY